MQRRRAPCDLCAGSRPQICCFSNFWRSAAITLQPAASCCSPGPCLERSSPGPYLDTPAAAPLAHAAPLRRTGQTQKRMHACYKCPRPVNGAVAWGHAAGAVDVVYIQSGRAMRRRLGGYTEGRRRAPGGSRGSWLTGSPQRAARGLNKANEPEAAQNWRGAHAWGAPGRGPIRFGLGRC